MSPWARLPAKYQSDRQAPELSVFRPGTGTWYTLLGGSPGFTSAQWGQSGDVPVPGDYDGDAKMDYAVWRPSTRTWYILPSGSPGTFRSMQWGQCGEPCDIPVPADYDFDGETDIAAWRPSTRVWYVLPSGLPGTYTATAWGANGDVPIPPVKWITWRVP